MKLELLAIIAESCCFTQNELVKWKLEVWLCAEEPGRGVMLCAGRRIPARNASVDGTCLYWLGNPGCV